MTNEDVGRNVVGRPRPARPSRPFMVFLSLLLVAGATVPSGCASSRHVVGPSTAGRSAIEGVGGATADLIGANEIGYTVFLIGDAGHAREGDPVLNALAVQASVTPDRSAVVFLGDNVYPAGLAPPSLPDRVRGERILRAQAAVGRLSGARTIFVPGNHDWAHHRPDGWNAVRRAEAFVRAEGAEQHPAEGCPGPATLDLGDDVRLIALDTQWWLHGFDKPQGPTSTCLATSEAEVLEALDAALANAGDRKRIVVAHHPLVTTGIHGGYFTWRDHVFPLQRAASWLWLPLPVIGSAYPLIRSLGMNSQDIASSTNRHMREAIRSVLARHRPMVFAAGHEHGLQVLEGPSAHALVVSGSGTVGHYGALGRAPQTRYARAAAGFVRIDVLRDGRVRLGVMVVNSKGDSEEDYSTWLREP